MKTALMVVCLAVLVVLPGCKDQDQNKSQADNSGGAQADRPAEQNNSQSKSPKPIPDQSKSPEEIPDQSKSPEEIVEGAPVGEPMDYLPTAIGTTLEYKIVLGETEPLRYKKTTWPKGETSETYASRSRFTAAMKKDGEMQKKEFALKLKVKGPAKKQGSLEYPIGVELTVEKDDLGIYERSKQVFWAASRSGGFICREVVTYSPNSPEAPFGDAWGSRGSEDGYTMKIFFFGANPGIIASSGDKAEDSLLFNGIMPIPDLNISGLRFTRIVKPGKNDGENDGINILNRGFREDLYFAKERGLVRLEQKIGGKTSMLWTRTD